MEEPQDYSYIIEFFKKNQELAAHMLTVHETNSDINEDYYSGMLDMCDKAIMFLEANYNEE